MDHVRRALVTLLSTTLAATALIGAVPGVVAGVGPPLCETNCATAFIPPFTAAPFGIASGPRGSVWVSLDSSIGRIDRLGNMTADAVPTANSGVGWLAVDPAGAVWFAERNAGKIGRITANLVITEFALPSPTAVPQGIVFGPDGNLYISEQGSNAIAGLNPTTGEATDFPVPTAASGPQSGALGTDGAIWFVERSAAKVGRMTLDGAFTEFALASGAFPNRIVAGPDGALWFTELRAGKIGRITTSGHLTEYPIAGGPVGIAVGKDDQLYVVLSSVGAVARVDLEGQMTGRWDVGGAVLPLLISTGFGLDLWVTDTFGGRVYRVTPYAVGQ